MAEMIPDRVPPGKSIGERKLFDRLRDLPDDHIVYYEPVVGSLHPDFIVIMPRHGLLVAEVKGWRAGSIRGANLKSVTVQQRDGSVEMETHPIEQAREYMLAAMKQAKAHPESAALLHSSGDKQGKFIFPFGHFAILSQISKAEIQKSQWGSVFPDGKILAADEFDEWSAFTAEQLVDRLATFFDPRWSFPALTPRQVDVLRGVLHPEIVVSPTPVDLAKAASRSEEQGGSGDDPCPPVAPPAPQPALGSTSTLKVLDVRQEQHAKSIGSGHRIIYGTAGSGKTVLLLSRARFLARENPDSKILVLCFNVALASYFEAVLRDCPNVDALHFHGWASRNGVRFNDDHDVVGKEFLKLLDAGRGDSGAFDAVLIDEAQDFAATWMQCAVAALKEPRDGDLIIVGDASQGLYPHGNVTWSSVGVQARGRVLHRKFDLHRNYRNTKQILEAALPFATPALQEEGEGILPAGCDPEQAVRGEGLRPLLLPAATRAEQCERALRLVRDLLAGRWAGQKLAAPLEPSEIGILYAGTHLGHYWFEFVEALEAMGPCVWINARRGRGNGDPRKRIAEPGFKVHTIHSAKGLQYRAVIALFVDRLPKMEDAGGEEPLERDRRLLYVALTRAEDFLAVCYSKEHAPYVKKLIASGALDVVR